VHAVPEPGRGVGAAPTELKAPEQLRSPPACRELTHLSTGELPLEVPEATDGGALLAHPCMYIARTVW